MIHSFSLTQDYAILFYYPVDVDATQIFSSNFHLMDTVKYSPELMTDVYVVNIHTGDTKHLETEPFYSLHHSNAYQTGDEIIIDLCENDPAAIGDYLRFDKLQNPPAEANYTHNPLMEFSRYTINMKTDTISRSTFKNPRESVFVNMIDYPRINEEFRGREYCFTYGISMIDYTRTALVKKDVCGESSGDKFWYKENHYLSEIWFFASPDAANEDDGVILTIAFNGEREESYLLL